MAQRTYKIEEDGLHHRFQQSRKKVQVFGGGFGNGKTTAAVMKALQLCKDYPGSNGLIARSTYPKLNDTIRKEFLAWCPPAWIESKNLSQDNVVRMKNGTIVNFRYIQQGGKSNESSTSNLLSATYDWIVVDQVEDPEIGEKDFLDLLGRLRGQTPYQGDDPSMPTSGPRWIILMCNPTRNWVFRKLIKPMQDYKLGIRNNDLLIDDDTGIVQVDLFEGSTYENAANLPPDFIKTLEMSYRGQMRERFLLGKWGAYEGLVYAEYDPMVHLTPHEIMLAHYDDLIGFGATNIILESYDHGIASPACYLFGFSDRAGNVFILDGYYEKERTIKQLSEGISGIRRRYGIHNSGNAIDIDELRILGDPAIFRRTSGNSRTVGTTVSGLFRDENIHMVRGNNDIISGIAKVQSYLYIDDGHENPFTGVTGAPRLYISNKLDFFDKEIVDYYWKKNSITGEYEDVPNDRNDHSMDSLKYLMTHRPKIVSFLPRKLLIPAKYSKWRERDKPGANVRKHRYG